MPLGKRCGQEWFFLAHFLLGGRGNQSRELHEMRQVHRGEFDALHVAVVFNPALTGTVNGNLGHPFLFEPGQNRPKEGL